MDLFGTTVADVVGELPTNMSAISATSTGLNTANVESYINRGAAQINGLLQRINLPLPLTNQITISICKQAVIAFAVHKCLQKGLNPNDPRITSSLEEFNKLTKMIEESPNQLGDDVKSTTKIHSNVIKRNKIFKDNVW